MADITQQLISRVAGLNYALELALREIAIIRGKEARASILTLRKEAIDAFRNSDIGPEREMEHADIAGPAIQAIEIPFDEVLKNLDD
jgi:hypothetical protein